MASSAFILYSVLLLSGAFVESRPQHTSFEKFNNFGFLFSEAVSNSKESISNIGSSITSGFGKIRDILAGGFSVSEDANNDLHANDDDTSKNDLESVKNATLDAIENLSPSQSEIVAIAIKTILFEVGRDLVFGETLYKSLVQRTIEVTSKMDSKIAQAIEEILLRVQKMQNGESFAEIMVEVSRTIHDHYVIEFD